MVEDTYRSWRNSTVDSAQALMIASDNGTVPALCERARAERVAAGEVEPGGVELANGSVWGVGDVVVPGSTIAPSLRAATPEREDMCVTATAGPLSDAAMLGELAVRHVRTAAGAVLPAAYVADHVELSYAVTGHGAQGLTVEVAHAVIQPTDNREYAYVALTRGRLGSHAHVATGELVEEPMGYQPDLTPHKVMELVLTNDDPKSAQDHIEAATARAESLFELVSRYRYAEILQMVDRVRPILQERGSGDLA